MTWSEYLMGFAKHAATKSKDGTKVGAVLVRDRTVLCAGFNGPPRGVKDTADRFIRPRKYLFAAHAETNALATALRNGMSAEGCALYVTHMPCANCAKLIIQSGVKHVVYGDGATSMPAEEFEAAKEMFQEAGVTAFHLKESA